MKYCCIIGCPNNKRNKNVDSSKVIFHMFPQNDVRRALWIKSLNLTNDVPCNTYVCSIHFNEKDYLVKLDPKGYLSFFIRRFYYLFLL